jgi:GAF domain-containing protein/HAMP domain-containing protein
MQILGRSGLGVRWERYLVDRTYRLVVGPGSTRALRPELWPGAITLIRDGASGTDVYLNGRDERVVGAYRWIEALDLALLIEVNYGYAVARPVNRTFLQLLPVAFAVILLFIGLSYLVMYRLLRPLRTLRSQMTFITEGDLDQALDQAVAPASSGQGELGALMGVFRRMIARFREAYSSLEHQIDARTASLQRRSLQLDAAARVSSTISAIRNVEELLDETVRLIPEYFDFDHVGIFLRAESGDYVVLQAASSEGGQRMLARGHKLRMGQGIVGAVAQSVQPRIALDVGEDLVFFDNPDLPDTRSEMALPLKVQGRLIGVMDVQSQRPEAFTDEDVAVLQSMADQVAMAIENARLLQESGEFLRELRRRYSEQVGQAWMRQVQEERVGYRYTGISVEPLAAADHNDNAMPGDDETDRATLMELEDGGLALRSPIMVRDHVLGHIVFRREADELAGDDEYVWDDGDVALVNAVCVQIGQALENARLLDEAQVRANFEQLAGDISERIRSSAVNVDNVLQTTLRELGVALRARGTIRFRPVDQWASSSQDNGNEPGS